MAFVEIHLSSQNALRRMVSFTALVPESFDGPFPTLYLLHGLSDDSTAWVRRTRIERYVESLPLVVVMPDCGRGWYTDSAADPASAVETFVVRDLIGFVDRTFNTRAQRSGRAICGQSMGGFGALKLALKHPQLFCAAASMSGAFVIDRAADPQDDVGAEMRLIFGPNPVGGPEDLSAIAEHVDRGLVPALYLDCGVEDYLIERNRSLHRHLEHLGIAHQYFERPGSHTWDYWDRSIVEVLRFVCGHLGVDPASLPVPGPD